MGTEINFCKKKKIYKMMTYWHLCYKKNNSNKIPWLGFVHVHVCLRFWSKTSSIEHAHLHTHTTAKSLHVLPR